MTSGDGKFKHVVEPCSAAADSFVLASVGLADEPSGGFFVRFSVVCTHIALFVFGD